MILQPLMFYLFFFNIPKNSELYNIDRVDFPWRHENEVFIERKVYTLYVLSEKVCVLQNKLRKRWKFWNIVDVSTNLKVIQ